MLSRIFPAQIDNNYRGYRLAIWLLVPIVLLRGLIGFNSIFFSRTVATSAEQLRDSNSACNGFAIHLDYVSKSKNKSQLVWQSAHSYHLR